MIQNIKTFFRMYKQMKEILSDTERRKATTIAFLSVFCALLETLGVGVILPFILAMLQPEQLMRYEKVSYILKLFNIETATQIVAFVGTGVIAVYIVKNSFILLFNRYKLYFRNGLEKELSVKMLKSYIFRPYAYFLDVNSSEIIRGVTSDNAAVATTVDSFSTLFNEGLTCFMLGIMLIIINPIMALGVMILAGGLVLTMITVLKKKVSIYAERARAAFADRYRYTYESVNGIKEIEVMKRQDSFLAKFGNASSIAAENNTNYLWIAMLPSRLTETIFISGLVIIVIVAFVFANDMSMIAAQLSALGVAAIRILPSVSNISNAMNSLVFQRPALESAYDNLIREKIKDIDTKANDSDDRKETKVVFQENLNIHNISWKYKDNLPNILEGLSMTIKKGESVGLIGESGAGKTTLADIILGLFVPQKGSVTVDGRSIFDDATNWHKMIGYVPQSVFLIDDTIRNNILFGIDEKDADEEQIERAIRQAQLSDFVTKQELGLDTVLGERGIKISGGQRQRIAIARALYYDPDVLVLDEATSALDNDTEAAVIEAINALQGQKTLIIVAHRLTTIEKCDTVYEIKEGKAVKVR